MKVPFGKTFSVGELIAELEKYPKDMPVVDMNKDCLTKTYQSTWYHSNYPYNLPDTDVIVIE